MRCILLLITGLVFGLGVSGSHARESGAPPRNTGAVAVSGGFLWVGSDEGVLQFDMNTGSFRRFRVADGLVSPRVARIAADSSGVLWFETGNGISRFDGDNWTSFAGDDSSAAAHFRPGIPGPDGILWSCSWNTVYRTEGENRTEFKLWDSGDDAPSIRVMRCDSRGTLWLGAAGIGGGVVMSYDGAAWNTYSFRDCNVTALCIGADDVKWFTSYRTLVRFDGDTWSYYEPENFSYENYLSAIADRYNRIWLIHPLAVVRFDHGVWTEYRTDMITGVEKAEAPHPAPVLLPNSPNPFNPATLLRFTLPSAGNVSLEIRDSSGRLVRTLVSGKFSAGPHALSWDGRDDSGRPSASGVYLPILRAGGKTIAGRILLQK